MFALTLAPGFFLEDGFQDCGAHRPSFEGLEGLRRLSQIRELRRDRHGSGRLLGPTGLYACLNRPADKDVSLLGQLPFGIPGLPLPRFSHHGVPVDPDWYSLRIVEIPLVFIGLLVIGRFTLPEARALSV